jgi:hypothetical protein
MPDVFLSYASADRERAREIASVFRQRGWSVWWDRTIPPGRTYDQVIEDALDASRCVVVLWTRNSVVSDWVKIEADEGARRGILVPVVLEEVRIPLAFRRIQAAHLIGWKTGDSNAEFDLLLHTISERLGEPANPPSPPAAAPVPEKPGGSAFLPRVNYVPVDDPAPTARTHDDSPQVTSPAPSNKPRAPRPHGLGLAIPIEDNDSAAPAADISGADQREPASEPEQLRNDAHVARRRVQNPALLAYLGFVRFIKKKLSIDKEAALLIAGFLSAIAILAFFVIVDPPPPGSDDVSAADSLASDSTSPSASQIAVISDTVGINFPFETGMVRVAVSAMTPGGQQRLGDATVEYAADSAQGWRAVHPSSSPDVFFYDRLPPGQYFIRVSHERYRPATARVSVNWHRITTISAVLVPR